jgi:predicted transcriptional regulator
MPTGVKPKISPEDTYSAFDTNEPFKSVARRFGTSPNTLRVWWVEKFGRDAFDGRSRKFHSASGTTSGKASAGKKRNLSVTPEPCEKCGNHVLLNGVQKCRLKRILCSACDAKERGVTCHCPVCGLGCIDERGLSGHMARPPQEEAEAHRAYLEARASAIWQGKAEGQDYVVCRLCRHKAETLNRHLGMEHGLTADQYRAQFSDALTQAAKVTENMRESARKAHAESPKKGLTKNILCSDCDREQQPASRVHGLAALRVA